MSQTTDNPPPLDRAERRAMDGAAAALAPLLVVVQGHRFGLGNQDFLIAWMRRTIDPAYLANDWFLSTPPHHPALTWLLAQASRAVGEWGALFGAHLFTRVLLLMGVWRLVDALLPGRRWVALLAMAGTLLEPRLQAGSHYLQGGHFEPAFLGMALAVWIMATGIRWAEGRAPWWPFALAGGVGIFAHLFVCLPVFGVTWLVGATMRRNAREAILAGIVAVLLGAPSLAPAAVGFFAPDEAVLTPQEIIMILQYRHPHHHQPWTWPVSHLVAAGILLIGASMAWMRLAPRGRLMIPAALLLYFIVSCAAFWICGRMQAVPLLAYLQPFRLLSLLVLLAQIAVIAGVAAHLPGRPVAAAILAFAVLLVMRGRGETGVGTAGIVLLLLSARPLSVPHFAWLTSRWLLAGVLAAGLALIVLLQAAAPVRISPKAIRTPHWIGSVEPTDPARAQLAEWIRVNTPQDALFAIPPDMTNFRVWERRAVVVDLKNVPYRAADLAEWRERLERTTHQRIEPFSTPQWMVSGLSVQAETARQYGADYIVLHGDWLGIDALYTGGRYAVLRVEAAESSPAEVPE